MIIKKAILKIRSKDRSILSTLFIPFTTLFIVAFFALTFFFINSEAHRIRDDAFLSIENNLRNITDGFDKLTDTLNIVSQNVVYSNYVKERFASYLGYGASGNDQSGYSNLQNTKLLYDLLVAIINPGTLVDQVYMYGPSGGCFGVGLDNAPSLSVNAEDYPWYEDVAVSHGEKYVFLDKDPRLAPYYSYEEGRYFLTLTRQYYNSINVPQGMIEVKKSVYPLTSSIDAYHSSYQESLYVLDHEGRILYPLPKEAPLEAPEYSEYLSVLQDDTIAAKPLADSFVKATSTHYLLYQTSEISGFTALAVVSKKDLLQPVLNYLFSTLIILLLACIAIVFVSYLISQRISTPLGKIYSLLSSFEISSDNLAKTTFPDINTSIIELNGLYQVFLKMQSQARSSLERELQLQNREMQSRMLALQAQMNPHFLYNSLAIIQAMADEGQNDKVYYLCQNISDILRYISSDSEQLVSFDEELRHTISYLECMKMRYEDELTYEIEVPEEMKQIRLPKLCLQLIVENAIKFSTKKKGPWKILINGHKTNQDWEVHIIDNGPGFSDEMLTQLHQSIQNIDENGVLPNLEISGMGLMNIYIRFKLLYQGSHIFRLCNQYPEGANITIGGSII